MRGVSVGVVWCPFYLCARIYIQICVLLQNIYKYSRYTWRLFSCGEEYVIKDTRFPNQILCRNIQGRFESQGSLLENTSWTTCLGLGHQWSKNTGVNENFFYCICTLYIPRLYKAQRLQRCNQLFAVIALFFWEMCRPEVTGTTGEQQWL